MPKDKPSPPPPTPATPDTTGRFAIREEQGVFVLYDEGICYDRYPTRLDAVHACVKLRNEVEFTEQASRAITYLKESGARKGLDEALVKRILRGELNG